MGEKESKRMIDDIEEAIDQIRVPERFILFITEDAYMALRAELVQEGLATLTWEAVVKKDLEPNGFDNMLMMIDGIELKPAYFGTGWIITRRDPYDE